MPSPMVWIISKVSSEENSVQVPVIFVLSSKSLLTPSIFVGVNFAYCKAINNKYIYIRNFGMCLLLSHYKLLLQICFEIFYSLDFLY